MEDTANEQEIIKYDLASVVKEIEETSGQKARLDTKLGTDYLLSNVELNTLTDMGFEYIGMTNKCGFSTPIYKLGNIEAVYIEQRLCIYSV